MTPKLIETYHHDQEGYNPFFIKDHWQVAQLNYTPDQGFNAIRKMDMHLETDEVFVLLTGNAVLIAGSEIKDGMQFEVIKMQPGITYNIPVNVWHNIAMDTNASVIIIEKSNTHLGDYICQPLDIQEQEMLSMTIQGLLHP